ncbi:MAG: DUF4199 domain-containing protein [Flavobacteriaceae bacterium]
MEGTTPKIGKFSLNYGLLLGVISVIFSLMLFFQEMHYERNFAIQAIGIVILFAVAAYAISQFKKANNGHLSLGQALKIGTGVAVVGGVISLIYFFLLSNVIEPDYMDKVNELSKVKAFEDNPNLTQEQWDQGMEMQEKFMWISYPVILIINAILGLISGLIIGLIMKKNPDSH